MIIPFSLVYQLIKSVTRYLRTCWYLPQSRWAKDGSGCFQSGSRPWSVLPGVPLMQSQFCKAQGGRQPQSQKYCKYREKTLSYNLIVLTVFVMTLLMPCKPLKSWVQISVLHSLLTGWYVLYVYKCCN